VAAVGAKVKIEAFLWFVCHQGHRKKVKI